MVFVERKICKGGFVHGNLIVYYHNVCQRYIDRSLLTNIYYQFIVFWVVSSCELVIGRLEKSITPDTPPKEFIAVNWRYHGKQK